MPAASNPVRRRYIPGGLPIWMALVLLGGLLGRPGVSGQEAAFSPEDQQSFQTAMEAVNRGDAATAQPLLTALQARHPHNFEINESLGLIDAAENNLQAALPLMAAGAAERPDSEAASVNLGVACLKLGKYGDAARALEHILLQRESRWKESIPELQTAIRLKPKDAAAGYRLALAWARTRERDKARAEIALQQKYSAQESRNRDERLSQMQTLLVTMR